MKLYFFNKIQFQIMKTMNLTLSRRIIVTCISRIQISKREQHYVTRDNLDGILSQSKGRGSKNFSWRGPPKPLKMLACFVRLRTEVPLRSPSTPMPYHRSGVPGGSSFGRDVKLGVPRVVATCTVSGLKLAFSCYKS